MSFSSDVKSELIRLPIERDCCALAELSALTQTTGSLGFGFPYFLIAYLESLVGELLSELDEVGIIIGS